jgi:hypothetical protein
MKLEGKIALTFGTEYRSTTWRRKKGHPGDNKF